MARHLKLVSVNGNLVDETGGETGGVPTAGRQGEKQRGSSSLQATGQASPASGPRGTQPSQGSASPANPVLDNVELLTAVALFSALSADLDALAAGPAKSENDGSAGEEPDRDDTSVRQGDGPALEDGQLIPAVVDENGQGLSGATEKVGSKSNAADAGEGQPQDADPASAGSASAGENQPKAEQQPQSTGRGGGSSYHAAALGALQGEAPLLPQSKNLGLTSVGTQPAQTFFGTSGLDILIGGTSDDTFILALGNEDDGVDVIIGNGGDDTLDLSGLEITPDSDGQPAIVGGETSSSGVVAQEAREDGGQPLSFRDLDIVSAGNGVLVDLDAHDEVATSAVGLVTIQVWKLDESGIAVTPIAHIEGVGTIIGTIGDDVMIGDEEANAFVYSASDGEGAAGAAPSYGFDVYAGGSETALSGRAPSSGLEVIDDHGDRADFSRLMPEVGSGEQGTSEHRGAAILPFDAKGIAVDLESSVRIEITDPGTGETIDLTGSLVSTHGGTRDIDLALIAWSQGSADAQGPAATVESIVGSGGADIILGDSSANTYGVVSAGEWGPSFFDGRSGSDTIDFSRLTSGPQGVELHLGEEAPPAGLVDNPLEGIAFARLTGDGLSVVAILANVENIVGSDGNDIFEGNSQDNEFTGGDGSDTFVFRASYVEGNLAVAAIGHDIIHDFNLGSGSSGSGSSGTGTGNSDRLVLLDDLFGFDHSLSVSDKLGLLLDLFAREDDLGLYIQIDENNSIVLENVHLADLRVDQDAGLGIRLSAVDSFIFI